MLKKMNEAIVKEGFEHSVGSRPRESSECAEGDINEIIEFLAVVAILSGFEMLQASHA